MKRKMFRRRFPLALLIAVLAVLTACFLLAFTSEPPPVLVEK